MANKKQQLTHVQFGHLVQSITAQREEYLKRFEEGVRLEVFAAELKVPITALVSAFTVIGLPTTRRKSPGTAKDTPENLRPYKISIKEKNAIITVLVRLCKELSVGYEELKPFIPGNTLLAKDQPSDK